ncbi:MAG: trypsin-like peptidase domain-containing protein [Candidatus Solibacter sp.]
MRAYGEIAERLRRSTVQIFNADSNSQGSGIVWSAAGLILTNAHVVRSAHPDVQLWDGRRLRAKVVMRDPRRDLASLRIDAADLPAATPGDSQTVRPGQLVLAVGNPMGFAGALSTGIVHSVGPMAGMGNQPWIRAGVRLAPGNSGGPLADAEGRVIGVNTAVTAGLGLAVPSQFALEFLRSGPAPALGVSLRPVDLGLLLLEVNAGGAAAHAGLCEGDILLTRHDALLASLDSGRPTLKLHFLRGDRRRVREVFVKLASPVEAAA